MQEKLEVERAGLNTIWACPHCSAKGRHSELMQHEYDCPLQENDD